MKKMILKTITLASALVFSMTVSAADWTLAKDKKGVQVFTKQIPGKKMKAFRGLTTIKAEIRDVAQLFNADYAYTEWLSDIVVSKRIKKVSDVEQYLYFVQKLPVIKNRDVVVLGKLTQDPATKVLTVSVTEATGMLKEHPDYVRMPSLRTSFTFTPAGDGMLDVVYEMEVDPGGKIPKSIANSVAVKAPYETLLNLRKISSSLEKYEDSSVENPFVNAS